jgi:hypothetical protein
VKSSLGKVSLLACLAFVVFGFMAGCPTDDQRVVNLSREAAERQAEQNRHMSEVVRTGGETQRELVGLQRDQQAEQAEITRQRHLLDSERRDIAGQRQRESILSPVIEALGGMLVIALALAFCWFLLFGLNRQNEEEPSAVQELLLEEFVLTGPDALPVAEKQLAGPGELPTTALTQRPT